MDKELTMGELQKVTFKNSKGEIVVCLYILPNGNLHPDSWTK